MEELLMKKQKKMLYVLVGALLAVIVLIAHRPGQGGTTNTAVGTFVTLP